VKKISNILGGGLEPVTPLNTARMNACTDALRNTRKSHLAYTRKRLAARAPSRTPLGDLLQHSPGSLAAVVGRGLTAHSKNSTLAHGLSDLGLQPFTCCCGMIKIAD